MTFQPVTLHLKNMKVSAKANFLLRTKVSVTKVRSGHLVSLGDCICAETVLISQRVLAQL